RILVPFYVEQAELIEPRLEFVDGTPGKYFRISAFVGRILLELVRPSPASGERQERSSMKPRQTHFGDRTRASTDAQTRFARGRDQQIARIPHAARDEHAAWPVFETDVVRRHDADDEAAASQRFFRRDTRRGTSASADDRNSVAR